MKRSAPGSHFPSLHGQMGIVRAHNAPSIWLFFPGIPEEWDGFVCVSGWGFQQGHCSQSLPSILAGRICPDMKNPRRFCWKQEVQSGFLGYQPHSLGMDVTSRDVLGGASCGICVRLVVPKLFDPLFVWIFLLSQEFLGDLG